MRIKSVYIQNFGKLSNKKIDFSDGFNLVFGENEAGKTTLMAFIKMMFYGYTGKSRDLLSNPRLLYKPWNNEPAAGSIEFTFNNTDYRLERTFLGVSTDKITLTNLNLGTSEIISGSEEIGARFFSLGSSAFAKSVFIDNSVLFDGENSGEINAKLSNLSSSGDEEISYEKILSRIADAKDGLLKKRSKNALISELEACLEQLEQEKQNSILKNRERDEAEQQISALSVKKAELQKKESDIFEQMKAAEKNERYIRISKFAEAVREYEGVEAKLQLTDGGIADKAFCDKAEQLLSKTENAALLAENKEKEYNAALFSIQSVDKNSDFADISVLEAEIKEKSDKAYKLNEEVNTLLLAKQNSRPKINLPLLIIGIILIIAGAISFMLKIPYISIGLCGVGAMLAVLGLLLKPKQNGAELEEKISLLTVNKAQLEGDITRLQEKINEMRIAASANKSLVSTYRENAVRLQSELLEIKNSLINSRAELFSHLAKYSAVQSSDEVKNAIAEIEANTEKLKELRIAAEYAAKGTGCATLQDAEKALSFLKAPVGTACSLEELKAKREEIRRELLAVTEEYNVLFGSAAAVYKGLRTPAEIEREINDVNERLAELKEYYAVLETAEETLGEAFSDIRKNFSGLLESTALQIFSALTNGKYGGITVSKSFDITVSESADFGSHPIDYLSKGAKGQAYFALRLALSRLLNENEQPLPIILDDIFAQFDDERTENGFKFLHDYSKENQVIFFTCHKENLNKNSGANIINL